MSRSEYQANLELATAARTNSDRNTGRVNIASGNRRAVVAKPAARGFFARVFGK